MIDLIVVDLTEFKSSLKDAEIDCTAKFEKTVDWANIKRGRDADTFYTRLSAYRALKLIIEKTHPSVTPYIVRNDHGKPELMNKKNEDYTPLCPFSLSHTENVAVFAFLKSESERDPKKQKIGVDIERHKKHSRMKHINDKYLLNVNNTLQNDIENNVNVCFYALDKIGKIFNKNDGDGLCHDCNEPSETVEFFDKWTRLEALLKADGGGFASLKSTEYLNLKVNLATYHIKIENSTYSVSLALL